MTWFDVFVLYPLVAIHWAIVGGFVLFFLSCGATLGVMVAVVSALGSVLKKGGKA